MYLTWYSDISYGTPSASQTAYELRSPQLEGGSLDDSIFCSRMRREFSNRDAIFCNKIAGKTWRISHKTRTVNLTGQSLDWLVDWIKLISPCPFRSAPRFCLMGTERLFFHAFLFPIFFVFYSFKFFSAPRTRPCVIGMENTGKAVEFASTLDPIRANIATGRRFDDGESLRLDVFFADVDTLNQSINQAINQAINQTINQAIERVYINILL